MAVKKSIFILTGVIAFGLILTFSLLYFQREVSKPNIILIVIDALRPDHLSCYGYPRDTSPNIDKIAQQGVRFTQAIAAGSWTVNSVPSILTGTYPFVHQVRDWNALKNSSIETLVHFLDQQGVQTALFTNHAGIDTIEVKDDFATVHISNNLNEDDYELTRKVINWLEANDAEQFFLYLHYQGVHSPYVIPEPYKSKYLDDEFRIKKEIPISPEHRSEDRTGGYDGFAKIPYVMVENNISDVSYYIAQYDGAISYTDEQVGWLMDGLQRLELLKNTIVILTADHGEMLGEHDFYFTHETCYENNIRVPLIVRFPGLFPKGKIIAQQVSLIDIAPTILEIVRIDIPNYMQGKSLQNLFKKQEFILHPYIYCEIDNTRAVRTEGWKLIQDGLSCELYNLLDDPEEQRNLINKEQGRFQELKMVLENYEAESRLIKKTKSKPLTDEQKEALRSLGYLQ